MKFGETMVTPVTALPAPEKTRRVRRRIVVKGNCTECAHYTDCPRMRGENICYGEQEVIIEEVVPVTEPSDQQDVEPLPPDV